MFLACLSMFARQALRASRAVDHPLGSAVGDSFVVVVLVGLASLLFLAFVEAVGLARRRPARRWLVALPAAVTAWSLAMLPLPPSDFWANGGTDTGLFVLFSGMVGVPLAWGLSRFEWPAPGWSHAVWQGALLTALELGLVGWLVEGYDSETLRRRAWAFAVLHLVGCVVVGSGRLLAVRR